MSPTTTPCMVYSTPMSTGFDKLFEPFEISNIDDPKLVQLLKTCKGNEAGDIIYVQVGHEVKSLPPGVHKIVEYFVSFVLRWDGKTWLVVAPYQRGK